MPITNGTQGGGVLTTDATIGEWGCSRVNCEKMKLTELMENSFFGTEVKLESFEWIGSAGLE